MLNCGDVFVYSSHLCIFIGYDPVNENWLLYSYDNNYKQFLAHVQSRLQMTFIYTDIIEADAKRSEKLVKLQQSMSANIEYMLVGNDIKKTNFKNCSSYVIKLALSSPYIKNAMSTSVNGSDIENLVRNMHKKIKGMTLEPVKELKNEHMYVMKMGNLAKLYYQKADEMYVLTDYFKVSNLKLNAYSEQICIEDTLLTNKVYLDGTEQLYEVVWGKV